MTIVAKNSLKIYEKIQRTAVKQMFSGFIFKQESLGQSFNNKTLRQPTPSHYLLMDNYACRYILPEFAFSIPLSRPVGDSICMCDSLIGHLYHSLNWWIFLVAFNILRAVGYCQDKSAENTVTVGFASSVAAQKTVTSHVLIDRTLVLILTTIGRVVMQFRFLA